MKASALPLPHTDHVEDTSIPHGFLKPPESLSYHCQHEEPHIFVFCSGLISSLDEISCPRSLHGSFLSSSLMSSTPTIVGKLVSLLNHILTTVWVGHVPCSVLVCSQSTYFLKGSGTIWCKSLMKFSTSVSVSLWKLHCLWSLTHPLNSIFLGMKNQLRPPPHQACSFLQPFADFQRSLAVRRTAILAGSDSRWSPPFFAAVTHHGESSVSIPNGFDTQHNRWVESQGAQSGCTEGISQNQQQNVSCACVSDLSSTLHFALFTVHSLSHLLLHPSDLSLHLPCGSVRSKTPVRFRE